jgi:16S rRNA (cytidine1402-2'-O)-methyltransferase
LTIHASQLKQAALAAAGGQQYPTSALYLVATPIGNLADLSLRAIHVLGLVDAVACEDTRVTGALLRHLDLDRPLIALHEHNEQRLAHEVVGRLQRAQRVAYCSDAGTPAVSDPGAALVRTVATAGLRVIPIPGASSVVAALSVAGDALAQGFRFHGFLPSKGAARQLSLRAACAELSATQVWLEAPHRIAAFAAELAPHALARRITLGRELTKQFETVVTLSAGELPAWLAADANRLRGEFVIVLHATGAPEVAPDLPEATQRTLDILLRELPLKQAVTLAAQICDAPRNALYRRALLQQGGQVDE